MMDDLETERMRLAACGVAAMANTREAAKERIDRDNPYWSASYEDVCAAVDREIALREANVELREQRKVLLDAQDRCTVETEELKAALRESMEWNWLDEDADKNIPCFDALNALAETP